MTILIVLLILTTVVLIVPIYKFKWVKAVMCAATIAFAVALGVNWLSPFFIYQTFSSPITLTALNSANAYAEGTEVWIKGAVVDDRWYPAERIFEDDANWLVQDQMVGWRDYSQPTDMKMEITGRIPAGEKRTLVLDANVWRGKFEVRQQDGPMILADAYHDQPSQDFSISLVSYIPSFANGLQFGLTGIAFLIVFGTIVLLFRKYSYTCDVTTMPDNQVLSMDILRILCIFTIVLLHCTNNTLSWDFATDQQSWYNYLYINVATSFAVPCFFMLSGALLIRNNTSVKTVLCKRSVKVAVPLLFWSSIYIIVRIYFWNETISFGKAMLSSFFSPQYWHLWFMYPLISLYFLLPLISQAYYHWDCNLKLYAGILLMAVPAVVFTVFQLAGVSLPMPWFALGFPELGLFIIGRILWEAMLKHKIPWWVSLTTLFFSFSAVCVTTYLLSMQQNRPVPFFGAYGNLSVTVFAVSIFVFILSLEFFWSTHISMRVKQVVFVISRLSMGIYFTHMIFLAALGNFSIFGVAFTNNEGSLHNMLLGAVGYFICSAMFVFVLSKIPVIKKLVV